MHTLFHDLNMRGWRVRGLGDGGLDDDAVNKGQLDAAIGGLPSPTLYEPVTNGDPDSPEILFVNGDVVMAPMPL